MAVPFSIRRSQFTSCAPSLRSMYAGFGSTLTVMTPPGMATGAATTAGFSSGTTGAAGTSAAAGHTGHGAAGRAAPPPPHAIIESATTASDRISIGGR